MGAFDYGEEGVEDMMNEDEDAGRITAFKLAFLLPLIEQSLLGTMNGKPSELRMKVSVALFLKDAISLNFISPNEVSAGPILRLITVVMNTIVADGPTVEYSENLMNTILNYAKMLSDSTTEEAPEEGYSKVAAFVKDIASHFFANDSIVRKHHLQNLQLLGPLLFQLFIWDADFKAHVRRVLYLARHDSDIDSSKLADVIWEELRLKTDKEVMHWR